MTRFVQEAQMNKLKSQLFSSNMKILENIKEDNLNLPTLCGPCDQSNYSVSAVYTDQSV